MPSDRCMERCDGTCAAKATTLVSLLGVFAVCDEHSRFYAPEYRKPLTEATQDELAMLALGRQLQEEAES